MERDQLPPHPTATYVLPEWKVVYVSVPKAACTSVKWMMAGLQGENPERFYRSLSREVTPATTIHRRPLWRKTPTLHSLSPARLAQISAENGWFIFTMTRHPTARLWSAWQSKLLLREPYWVERFGDEEWMPRIPTSTDDVVDDFHRFVKSIGADPSQRVLRDRHFRRQHGLIKFDAMPYTRIYDTSEFTEFRDDLLQHLSAQNWQGELVQIRTNETPLPLLRRILDRDVMTVLDQLYADDYVKLGYSERMPPKVVDAEEYPPAAVDAVGMLVERAERIAGLAKQAQRLSGRLRDRKSMVLPPTSRLGDWLRRQRRRR